MRPPIFDNEKLKSTISRYLEQILGLHVLNEVSNNLVQKSEVKLKIFTTTSALKTHLLSSEILDLVERNKFFPAIATLRILFEELILLIFALAKMERKKSWADAYYLLTKLNIGRRTRESENIAQDKRPYNIVTALAEAEKYVSKQNAKLNGIFNRTYTFISDFTHPNAPSHYYFWESTEHSIKFINRKKVTDPDLGLVLNYTCMTLELFLLYWGKLDGIKLPPNHNQDR